VSNVIIKKTKLRLKEATQQQQKNRATADCWQFERTVILIVKSFEIVFISSNISLKNCISANADTAIC